MATLYSYNGSYLCRALLVLTTMLGLLQQRALAQDTLSYAAWRLVQADEFDAVDGDSSLLAARWQFAYPWGRNLGGQLSEYYTGREVNVRDGTLRLTAHRLPAPLTYRIGSETRHLRYTSGMLYSQHNNIDSLRPVGCSPADGFSYGLFEIRCRQPYDTGSFPAYWLYGAPDEIDIFEANPQGFSNNIILHDHSYWRQGPVEQRECPCYYYWPGKTVFSQEYHRYAVEWLPDHLTFYFDGVPIRRETRFRPLGCAMALIANLSMWAWAGPTKDSLEIDYIRIYRPREAPPLLFGTEAERLPTPGFRQFPRAVQPEKSNPAGQQGWQIQRQSSSQVQLTLSDNFNPPCFSNFPLPITRNWRPAWVGGEAVVPIRVTVADTAALHWVIFNSQGNPQLMGQAHPGSWTPPITQLAPGCYLVRLTLGSTVLHQPLYIIGRSAQ